MITQSRFAAHCNTHVVRADSGSPRALMSLKSQREDILVLKVHCRRNRTFDYWLESEILKRGFITIRSRGRMVMNPLFHISDSNQLVEGSIPDYVHFAQDVSTECGK